MKLSELAMKDINTLIEKVDQDVITKELIIEALESIHGYMAVIHAEGDKEEQRKGGAQHDPRDDKSGCRIHAHALHARVACNFVIGQAAKKKFTPNGSVSQGPFCIWDKGNGAIKTAHQKTH